MAPGTGPKETTQPVPGSPGPNLTDPAGKKGEKLPKGGEHPFEPKKHKGGDYLRDMFGRFLDKWGNAWEWDPIKGEWDVQHPDGSHTNIGPDGNVTHGPDKF